MATTAEKTTKPGNGSRTPQALESEISQLKADIAKLTKQLQATGEHSFSTARRAAAESVGQLRAQGEAAIDRVRSGADDIESQLTASIREKPLTALGIAVGVGFVLAWMMRR